MKEKKIVEMNILKIKSAEQKNALNSWASKGFVGSIIAGTGFGKSRCGVLAAAHAIEQSGGKGLLLVPTTQLQTQFEDEFRKSCIQTVFRT